MVDTEYFCKKAWVDNKDKNNAFFFLCSNSEECDRCNELYYDGEEMFLRITWKKNEAILELLCTDCQRSKRKYTHTTEWITFYLVETVPKLSVPFFPRPPLLGNLKSHEEAIYSNKEAELIDHTRYSGKENYTFSLKLDDKRDIIPITEMQDTVAVQSGKETVFLPAHTAQRIKEDDAHMDVDDAIVMLDSVLTRYTPLPSGQQAETIERLEHKEDKNEP